MSRSPARRRSGELSAPVDKLNPTETHSITFDWPLHDLKHHFDSSNNDTKSKVIKSVSFGQGRWTVLFYAQSGLQQFCSLYLNAEPTPEEKNQNKSPWDTFLTSSSPSRSNASLPDKAIAASDEGWTRQGLFRFTFKILTLNKGVVLATKEACNHAFSQKTSNWGWAQFASRDTVFYGNNEVQQTNGFLISVTITASAERPKPLSVGVTVPPALIEAMGSLLDDPDHSDVVFVIRRKRRHPKTGAIVTQERRIYAIKKILSSRCEYFRDMFDSGFLEADATVGSDDETEDDHPAGSVPSRGVGQDQLGLLNSTFSTAGDDEDDELGLEDSDEEMDVDEVYEMGRPNLYEERNGSVGTLFGNMQMASSSRRMRETSSDIPVVRAAPESLLGHSNSKLQPDTPPQSRSRQANGNDAGTDSGEDIAKAQGMSAFQTPQHSPRELRDGATFSTPSLAGVTSSLPQQRPGKPPHGQATTQQSANSKVLPQRRKSATSPSTSFPSSKKRRKVVVRDASYATYKALLYYLYTDTIAFAPLHSHFYLQTTSMDDHAANESRDPSGGPIMPPQDASAPTASYASSETGLPLSTASLASTSFAKDRRRAHQLRQHIIDEYCSTHTHIPAPCSAKSMYRLADKLQIPELKKRAQQELENNLTVDNIVWEVFSGFNSQFPAIRKMETDFLLKHWNEVKDTEVMKSIFSRPSAHPGLADVWPHLLSQLEFRGAGASAGAAAGSERSKGGEGKEDESGRA